MRSDDWLSELKDRIDIVDVVSRYVSLTQKGSNFWGCCPFHSEKTASFAVNSTRQAYYCFGCHESGDAIKFVEKMEAVGFMDAVKILADRVGFTIPSFKKGDENIAAKKARRERLCALLTETARFYYANLKSASASVHREYMERRGLTGNIAKMLGIGASLDFSSLPQFLLTKGYHAEEMKSAGVCAEKNGRLYDCLGGRLIFPIIDSFGQVVGFGGRLLEKADFAKYKNTSETEIFVKSNILYGLNLVKKFRTGNLESLIIVEGYMDAAALYKVGLCNVAASMGTSLTEGQVRIIKRLTDKVYISYDGDSAGQKATMRGLDLLVAVGIDVRVVELTDGKDPDDVVCESGADGYMKLLERAIPLTEYKLKNLKLQFNLNDKIEKQKYISAALAVVRQLGTATAQEEYLKQLKSETGFTYESLKNDMHSSRSEQKNEIEVQSDGGAPLPAREDKAARFIIYSRICGAAYVNRADDLSGLFDVPLHRKIYEYVEERQGVDAETILRELSQTLEGDDLFELEQIRRAGEDFKSEDSKALYYAESVLCLKLKDIEVENGILTEELKNCTDAAARSELGKKITKNVLRMHKLKSDGNV